MTNSLIESFIKKYRSAVAAKSKDIRISIDEASDIIGAFATVNTSNSEVISLLNQLIKEIQELKANPTPHTGLDGGSF